MVSWYFAYVPSEWFLNGPSRYILLLVSHWVFNSHVRCTRITIVRSLASILITILSPEITTSINIRYPFSISRIIMSGLLLWMVLSVCTCWFHNMFILNPYLFLLILVHVHTSVVCPAVPLFPCICWSVVGHTLYHVFLCTVVLPV